MCSPCAKLSNSKAAHANGRASVWWKLSSELHEITKENRSSDPAEICLDVELDGIHERDSLFMRHSCRADDTAPPRRAGSSSDSIHIGGFRQLKPST
jgi:hypothetical protein